MNSLPLALSRYLPWHIGTCFSLYDLYIVYRRGSHGQPRLTMHEYPTCVPTVHFFASGSAAQAFGLLVLVCIPIDRSRGHRGIGESSRGEVALRARV